MHSFSLLKVWVVLYLRKDWVMCAGCQDANLDHWDGLRKFLGFGIAEKLEKPFTFHTSLEGLELSWQFPARNCLSRPLLLLKGLKDKLRLMIDGMC